MPSALAHGPDGLLVADSRNARIQVFDSDGGFRKAFWRVEVKGEKKNSKDGYEKEYRDLFRTATCVAVTPDGRIVASDESTDSVFFIIPGEDRVEVKPIKWGFKSPRGLAVDRKGRIYVCNTGRSEIDIFKPDGTHDLSHSVYHTGKRLEEPVGVAIEPVTQTAFVTDAKLGRIVTVVVPENARE
jgi:DNA-binding beta-propeller fold protein YncE